MEALSDFGVSDIYNGVDGVKELAAVHKHAGHILVEAGRKRPGATLS